MASSILVSGRLILRCNIGHGNLCQLSNEQTPRMILNMQMAAEPREPILEFTTDLGTMPNNETQLSSVHGATEQSGDPS